MSEATPIHQIRQRLIDDMTLRGFTEPTQKSYIRIESPAQFTANDSRK
jgi:hypothetical protein